MISYVVATWPAAQLSTLLNREALSHGGLCPSQLPQHRPVGRILSGWGHVYTAAQVSSAQLAELEAHIAAATAASAAAGPTGEGAHGSASEQPPNSGRASARVKRRVKRHVLVRCAHEFQTPRPVPFPIPLPYPTVTYVLSMPNVQQAHGPHICPGLQ